MHTSEERHVFEVSSASKRRSVNEIALDEAHATDKAKSSFRSNAKLSARRVSGIKVGQKTARAVRPNAGVRLQYQRQLEKLVRDMAHSVEYWLEAAYKNNAPLMAQDALPSNELKKRISELSKRWVAKFDEAAQKIAERFVKQGKQTTDAAFMSALRDAGWTVQFKPSRMVQDAMNATIAENVSLIKSIPSQYLTQVEGSIMRGFSAGRDLKQITDELQKHYGVSARRAARIALDQSNKLSATVTQARRLELGITQAVWVHSGGGKKPRASHVKAGHDKLVFDVEKGAYIDGDYIQPGYLPYCRCVSKSILPF